MSYVKRTVPPVRRVRPAESSPIVEHPDLDKVGYLCRRVSVASLDYLQEAIPDLDMNSGQLGTLMLIGSNPGITPTEICRAIGREKPVVTAAIDHLAKKRMVSRRLSPKDRRSFSIHLTKSGQRFYETVRPRVALADQMLTHCLTPSERATLLALLYRIFESEC